MKILELNHVAIHVADVAASCAFYQRVLCLQPLARPAFDFPGAWFRFGSCQELHLIGNRAGAVSAGSRSNHFALRVDDIAAWERHLQEAGAAFQPRKQRPDGAHRFFSPIPTVTSLNFSLRPIRCRELNSLHSVSALECSVHN